MTRKIISKDRNINRVVPTKLKTLQSSSDPVVPRKLNRTLGKKSWGHSCWLPYRNLMQKHLSCKENRSIRHQDATLIVKAQSQRIHIFRKQESELQEKYQTEAPHPVGNLLSRVPRSGTSVPSGRGLPWQQDNCVVLIN